MLHRVSIASLIAVFAACRAHAPVPSPAYLPAAVTVFVSPDGVGDVDASCRDITALQPGPRLAASLRERFAHAGYRMADAPGKDVFVVVPTIHVPTCFKNGEAHGDMRLDVSQNGVLVDAIEYKPADWRSHAQWVDDAVSLVLGSKSIGSVAGAPMPTTQGAAISDPAMLVVRPATSMLVLPLHAKANTSTDLADSMTSVILAKLDGVRDLRTVGKDDVQATLSADKQAQALGCDAAACMAEIGGALGVELVMYGDVGVVGSKYNVNVSVVRARDSTVVARSSIVAPKNDDAVIEQTSPLVSDLVAKLNERLRAQ